MNFKLGFGPMSIDCVDTLAKYAEDYKRPLMFIASRNQVDASSGYVMTTKDLAHQLSKYQKDFIMLCRDHCGPYFLDIEKNLSLSQAVEATKKTIAADIENGFDLIHIDTSRCENPYRVADELFDFCLKLKPTIKFEFGTEENVGVAAGIKKYQDDVQFASQFPNMEFVVAQTGSLTMENRQVGSFDVALVKQLVSYADAANVKLKEHNADYLNKEQIEMRRQAGVHACNIAPQLGVIQTKTILDLAKYFDIDTTEFKQTVLDSGKWKKWIIDGDSETKILIAGHYCFSSDAYKKLEKKLTNLCNLQLSIERNLSTCLDLYYDNLY